MCAIEATVVWVLPPSHISRRKKTRWAASFPSPLKGDSRTISAFRNAARDASASLHTSDGFFAGSASTANHFSSGARSRGSEWIDRGGDEALCRCWTCSSDIGQISSAGAVYAPGDGWERSGADARDQLRIISLASRGVCTCRDRYRPFQGQCAASAWSRRSTPRRTQGIAAPTAWQRSFARSGSSRTLGTDSTVSHEHPATHARLSTIPLRRRRLRLFGTPE